MARKDKPCNEVKTELLIPRRYWPSCHDLLSRAAMPCEPIACGEGMLVRLGQVHANILLAALPEGAAQPVG